MKPPPRVLGFNDPWHDSNFSIYGAGSITHVEVERHTRRKYESINPILAFCEMFPNDVESFFHVAFEETDFPLGSLIKKIARLKEQQTDIDALIETLDVPYGHPEVLYSATDLLPVSNNTDSVKAFLRHLSRQDVSLYFCGHHAAHAANAYLSSSFADALVVTLDGGGTDYSPAGGWTNVDQKSFGALTHRIYGSIFECNGVECRPTFHLTEMSFGLAWYRTTTKILGLASGEEGTVMAMAAFGDPAHFRSVVAEPWLWSFEQGNLDLPFAAKAHACIRTEQDRFDFAASLQEATEERLRSYLTRFVRSEHRHLCLAGGFFLNCLVAGKIRTWFPNLADIYMPPVPYDGGISIGNAQLVYHCLLGNAAEHQSGQPSSYTMGRRYSRLEVMSACRSAQVRCSTATVHEILRRLARGEIIGLFSGSAESGRRALGNRSIIADPRADASRDRINSVIKHRQSFRPFAPMVLAEHTASWFECDDTFNSPYMSFAIPVRHEMRNRIPAVVHHDGTARVQTVHRELSPNLHSVLKSWHAITGVPILLNTSFNDREPIVETPDDAIHTLKRVPLDGIYFADFQVLATK